LLNFVNNLLGQAQIESGKVILNVRPFAPDDLLKVISSTTKVVAQSKGLKLIGQVAPDVPATLSGDLYWLRQIVVNLVGNAVKFTDQGTVKMRVYQVDENYWAIQVSDTGCGIPVEAQSYIFDPFRQADEIATSAYQTGSGLGLSIVKQLTALMGGQVTLISEVGRGSTFTVLLPLAPMQEEAV
jgi:signal transduction histidine kinase